MRAARPPNPEAKRESAIGSARAAPEEFGRFEEDEMFTTARSGDGKQD